MLERNLTWHSTVISKELRQQRKGHRSFVVWLTGLSGAGKSTIANTLEAVLFDMGIHSYVLDGDNMRMGLNRNLGFSEEDRQENIRRVAEVSKLFVDAGIVVIAAVISPFEQDRAAARKRFPENEFIEIFANCPVEECIKRDPKGLYRKALAGELQNFTGVDAPYESPNAPDLEIRTDLEPVDACVEQIIRLLKNRHLLGNAERGVHA